MDKVAGRAETPKETRGIRLPCKLKPWALKQTSMTMKILFLPFWHPFCQKDSRGGVGDQLGHTLLTSLAALITCAVKQAMVRWWKLSMALATCSSTRGK